MAGKPSGFCCSTMKPQLCLLLRSSVQVYWTKIEGGSIRFSQNNNEVPSDYERVASAKLTKHADLDHRGMSLMS
jgi:hypothetical protein